MSDLLDGRRPPAQVVCTLARMKHAIFEFQYRAVNSGDHAMVEFANLMQNYLECAERTFANGMDFVQVGIARCVTLDVTDRDRRYIAEKLGCIYGELLTRILETAAEDLPNEDKNIC